MSGDIHVDVTSTVPKYRDICNKIRGGENHESRQAPGDDYQHRFNYKPLDRSKGALRLIKVFPLRNDNRIRCRIERHHVATASYVALSYVWGTDDAKKTILLNGKVFRVRPNLYSFLHHVSKLRSLTDELYWIDAICINQYDLNERNGHVRHMGSIYSGAHRVIAWLGNKSKVNHNSRNLNHRWTCCTLMEEDQRYGVYHKCNWKVPSDTSWDFVLHEYWNRLWIAQELSLGTRVDILWRGRFYNWFRLRKHLSVNLNHQRHPRNQSRQHETEHQRNMEYIRNLPISRYLSRAGSESLSNLVPRFSFHECRIGHDHIFALLSIASDGAAFEPDYAENEISLLLRLLEFSYPHPTIGLTTKIGSSIGVDPPERGLPVERLGYPQLLLQISEIRGFYYRPLDRTAEDDLYSNVLIRIPDVNLHFLFRPSNNNDDEKLGRNYTFVSRVVAISALVEQGRSKFGQSTRGRSSISGTASNAIDALHPVQLHEDPATGEFTLRCNWAVVVRIYELSHADAKPGRLESRIRSWNEDYNEGDASTLMFSVRA